VPTKRGAQPNLRGNGEGLRVILSTPKLSNNRRKKRALEFKKRERSNPGGGEKRKGSKPESLKNGLRLGG